MRKRMLYILATFSVPLLLFVNVWQSQRYMVDYFEVKSLVKSQESLILENKRLLNRVAELDSPMKIVDKAETVLNLYPIKKDGVVRLSLVGDNE